MYRNYTDNDLIEDSQTAVKGQKLRNISSNYQARDLLYMSSNYCRFGINQRGLHYIHNGGQYVNACRMGAKAFAEAVKPINPDLAFDIELKLFEYVKLEHDKGD